MKAAELNPAAAFPDPKQPPTADMMRLALGNDAFADWHALESWLREQYPEVDPGWAYSDAHGWRAIPVVKKRRVCYFIPRRGDYEVRLVLGDKALQILTTGPHAKRVAELLEEAVRYPEGTAIIFTRQTWHADLVFALVDAKLRT